MDRLLERASPRDRSGALARVIIGLHRERGARHGRGAHGGGGVRRADEFDQGLIFQIVRLSALAKLTQIK
jgi:hypothetical protein